jgi:hypothetical protein
MTGNAKPLLPKIRVPKAPDFASQIGALLEEAGVKNTPDARSDLVSILQLAWAESKLTRASRASPELFKQLIQNIKKTQSLLRRLERFEHTQNIGFDLCPVGDGTVQFATVQEMKHGENLELPRSPPPLGGLPEQISSNGIIVAINVQRMLDRLLREIARYKPNRKRGNQSELDKRVIVARAAYFFRRYSTVEPTTYFDGRFAKFCKRFYEVVTGKTLSESGLEKTIREEVKRPTFRTQKSQKT